MKKINYHETDVVIVDPYDIALNHYDANDPNYHVTKDDWMTSFHGELMEKIGIENYVEVPTLYQEITFKVTDADVDEVIANVTTNGHIGVFDLNEVLQYNPSFLDVIKEGKAVVVPNFSGTIVFKILAYKIEGGHMFHHVIINGYGTTNFIIDEQ